MSAGFKNVPPLTDEEEAEIQRQIAANPDAAEATDEALAEARPFAEAHPELAESIERGRASSPQSVLRASVTLRLDPRTLDRWKRSGEDWRTRLAHAIENELTP